MTSLAIFTTHDHCFSASSLITSSPTSCCLHWTTHLKGRGKHSLLSAGVKTFALPVNLVAIFESACTTKDKVNDLTSKYARIRYLV